MASSAETLGVVMMAAGAYLVWFSVHYWRDQAVVWPTTPIKSLLTGGDLPSPVESEPVEEIYQQQLASLGGLSQSITAGAIPQAGSTSTSTGGGTGTTPPPGTSTSGSQTQNATSVAQYLMANGYTSDAAGGIIACIYGEDSSFDPETLEDPGTPVASNSGGGGLIQWTPISAYADLITGDASADLNKQMAAIITYNNAQGASLVTQLNAQTSISAAADFYSEKFERPASPLSDVSSEGIQFATDIISGIGGSTLT